MCLYWWRYNWFRRYIKYIFIGKNLDDIDIELLCENFEFIPTLRVLLLDDNNINSDGAINLRYHISDCPCLQKISLGNNNICDEGFEYLCDGLITLSHMLSVDISSIIKLYI